MTKDEVFEKVKGIIIVQTFYFLQIDRNGMTFSFVATNSALSRTHHMHGRRPLTTNTAINTAIDPTVKRGQPLPTTQFVPSWVY